MATNKELSDKNRAFSHFLQFWIWEYGRRHTHKNDTLFKTLIKKDYNQSVSILDGLVTYQFDPPINTLIFHESGCEAYWDADELIRSFINNDFEYKYEVFFKGPHEEVMQTSLIRECVDWPIIQKEIADNNNISIESVDTVVFDFIKLVDERLSCDIFHIPKKINIDDALVQLAGILYRCRGTENIIKEAEKFDSLDGLYVAARHQSEAFKNKLLIDQGLKKNPKNNLPRAVGLWLWDYIKENNCELTSAVTTLEETHDLKRLNLENKEVSDFGFWFRRTKECITEGKVLSFSKKGNPKS